MYVFSKMLISKINTAETWQSEMIQEEDTLSYITGHDLAQPEAFIV